MIHAPNVLVIAPSAPPTNAAEAIQVRNILAELDKVATGRLVAITPDKGTSWTAHDASLELHLSHFDRQHLKLPLHRITHRILTSHRMARFHVPDTAWWITGMAGRIVGALSKKPDIIYSRSYPISSALLAQRLKHELNVPWIMHLSDPWADSPYSKAHASDVAREKSCFEEADLITVTTESQAAHFRSKYPSYAAKIAVTPNVMTGFHPAPPAEGDKLRLLFAGNLYGDRSPEPLVRALAMLRPELRTKIRLDVYGKAQPLALALLHSLPETAQHHGAVSYQDAYAAQKTADIIVSIEPDLKHPLSTTFMPSKVLEALSLGKPLLAITPIGSETANLCNDGYGWAITPDDIEGLAKCLAERIEQLGAVRGMPAKEPPLRYNAAHVTHQLLQHMQRLMAAGPV